MKRILAILLAALLLCCVFVACDKEEPKPERPTASSTEKPTTEEPTTEEPTTEEITTDDGLPDMTDVYVDVWDVDDTTHSAQKIDANHKGIGICVTIPEGGYLYESAVQAPSYSDNIGNLTIKIFAWNTDYDTTVAAEPIYAQEFVDFADNSDLVCEFEEGQIPAGKYLILACDAVDEGEGVGLWMGKPFKSANVPEELVKYEIESWINGKNNKKSIAKFSLTITEPEA
ncbi:MAG: hypothetical protein IIU63_06305 [Clostridia bacterium]|nr:hypothetical protein [Clostridia bacterium]MBQ5362945.1 hypothetical protein [Clostridia bacterium]